jgi:hypothetical protein
VTRKFSIHSLHATGGAADRGTAPQYVEPNRDYIIDLARRQSPGFQLIKAETSDK